MDNKSVYSLGSDSQGSEDLVAPGTSSPNLDKIPVKDTLKFKGIENAKRRLQAFSIQKKFQNSPMVVPKPVTAGGSTILIGKLSSVKSLPKSAIEDDKKVPKPPKSKESYKDIQKKTLSEIEDMKRKMELVELGIPLGLICPNSSDCLVSPKAMPTKAMPPIRVLGLLEQLPEAIQLMDTVTQRILNKTQIEKIITEARKAKAEGKEYKFDYSKLWPDYENPFQRKNKEDDVDKKDKSDKNDRKRGDDKKDWRRSERDRNDRRHYRNDDRSKYRDKDRSRRPETRGKERDSRNKEHEIKKQIKERNLEKIFEKEIDSKENVKDVKETEVDLKEFLVCDSWSLDTEDKTNSQSPVVKENIEKPSSPDLKETIKNPIKSMREQLLKQKLIKFPEKFSNLQSPEVKIKKLKPVIDSFKFEIDEPNEDDVLDIFDESLEIESFAKPKSSVATVSPCSTKSDHDASDILNDDTFLESVIDEIKKEGLSDVDSHDKGLVEYDSPKQQQIDSQDTDASYKSGRDTSMSDYSDSYKSTESGYKTGTSVSSRRSSESRRVSSERDFACYDSKMAKVTVKSLEMWSFVLKICQPLLFRHDKNICYKTTQATPKVWFTENPKICNCVKDRVVVYEELEMCKNNIVDRVYGCDQIVDTQSATKRSWYPPLKNIFTEQQTSNEWETEDNLDDKSKKVEAKASCEVKETGKVEVQLDTEYQRFMEAVWPEISQKSQKSTTPDKSSNQDRKQKDDEILKKTKKTKVSSENWSQESDVEAEDEKSVSKKEKVKARKRKRSSSSSESDSEENKKRKKANKKKMSKKQKAKSAKKRLVEKKLKKLREKQKKKMKRKAEESDDDLDDSDTRKKDKKNKKKKQLKLKQKKLKRKKKAKASSSSSSSSSSSESESDQKSKKRDKKKKAKRKRKQSTSESTQSDDLFDVNILNNIKSERCSGDERNDSKKLQEFSPRRKKEHRPEIINVKELQNDFEGSIEVKKERMEIVAKEDMQKIVDVCESNSNEAEKEVEAIVVEKEEEAVVVEKEEEPARKPKPVVILKPPLPIPPPAKLVTDESSQCSSQESVYSVKEQSYEKDDSHLRPPSPNSNYSFNDVINASQTGLYDKKITTTVACEDKFENYEQGDYEMYEHMAMEYQRDTANQQVQLQSQRIETVVQYGGARGEIKCDWRPDGSAPAPIRNTRWGLKPNDVNIVLTGGSDAQYTEPSVYKIESLASKRNSSENSSIGYDEAYLDMYGASDRLQYGDCFELDRSETELSMGVQQRTVGQANRANIIEIAKAPERKSSLDARIDKALKDTILGEVTKEMDSEKDNSEKGILANPRSGRAIKRVSFADGYKPGQDSDVEDPPVKKKRKSSRLGCAWPCPAWHPDHVALWDALPPPPPPPGHPPMHCAPRYNTNPMMPGLIPDPPPVLMSF